MCGGALIISQRKSQTNSVALKREAAALSPQALGTIAMLIQTAPLNLRMCFKLLLFNAHPFSYSFLTPSAFFSFHWSCIGKHLEGHYANSTCTISELFTQGHSDLRFEKCLRATRLATLQCVLLFGVKNIKNFLCNICYQNSSIFINTYLSPKVNTETSTFKYLITM